MLAAMRGYRHALFLTGAAASWGVATVISKRAVDEIAPLTLLPVQLAVSVFTLLILTRARGLRVSWSPQLRLLGALGVLNPGISYALSLLGLARITASLSVVLWTVEPLLILAMARWLLRDRITRPLAIAMGAAFGGVLLIVARPGTGGTTAGAALTIAGVGACAVYTVICRKLLATDAALTVVMIQQSCALGFAVALFAAAQAAGARSPIGAVSGWGWLSAVTSGIFYYAVGFWLYLTGLRRVPAAVAGMFINLIPVFGITAGYLLLAEHLSTRQYVGAGIVVAAVVVASVLRREPASPSRPTPQDPPVQ
jgi:probable blue pigment (indigoidine) exporter